MAEVTLVRDQAAKPNKVLTITSFLVPCFLIAITMYSFRSKSLIEIPTSAVPISAEKKTYFPVSKGSCVFISDAAVGASREAALALAKKGIHVLAGIMRCIIVAVATD